MTSRMLSILAAVCAAAVIVPAGTLAAQTIAITGGKVYPVSGPPIENGTVLIKAGEAWINMTRMAGVDGTDPRSLTAGEIEGRRQIPDIQRYLKEYVPGFEQSYFTKTAP